MRNGSKRIVVQKVCAILLFSFIFIGNGYSQGFKLAGIKYANYLKSPLKNVSGNQENSFQEFGAFVNFPKVLKKDTTILINGVGYGWAKATMYNYPMLQTSEYQKKLQSFYYQLTFLHTWNEKWSLVASLKPTIASDFDQKLSSDDLVFQGSVTAMRKINDRLKLGFGIANSTRWGSPITIPVVSLQYKSHRHKLEGVLPAKIVYTYALPKEKWQLGIGYTRSGANFNISDTNIGAFDKINYSRANIGLSANYRLTKLLRLEAHGGVSAGRIYRLIDSDNNVLDFDSKASPYFSLGIALVSPKK